jgi:cation diffusion facilitator family transporter
MNNGEPTICVKTAKIAIITASFLAIIKIATGISSGSMALLTSAADSILDLFMSFGNMLALRQADKPADNDHPYGHGKFETAATLFQSVVITTSGLFIIYESIQRLINGNSKIIHLDIGIAVLAFSGLISWLLSRHLKRIGIATTSTALQADALHYATDVYSNLVLLLGLVLVRLLHWDWLDPLLSIGVGLYIMSAAFTLLKGSMDDLLDSGLPEEQLRQIIRAIECHNQEITGYHNLRTRRSGKNSLIDFHLTFCQFKTIYQAHNIADQIEEMIKRDISNADITIHLEPTDCTRCRHFSYCNLTERSISV